MNNINHTEPGDEDVGEMPRAKRNENKLQPGLRAQSCNPSYSGSCSRRIVNSVPAWVTVLLELPLLSMDTMTKKTVIKDNI